VSSSTSVRMRNRCISVTLIAAAGETGFSGLTLVPTSTKFRNIMIFAGAGREHFSTSALVIAILGCALLVRALAAALQTSIFSAS
jgi:hypothetical protein